MRIRLFLSLIGVALAALAASATNPRADDGDTRAVILATRRDHRVQFFDAETLMPLGSIAVNNLASHAIAAPDSQTLFLAAAQTPDANTCCAVFAVSLQAGTMCQVLYPALKSTLSADGQRVFLQRGNTGIDVFDTRTLTHLPGLSGPGVYNILPSPDGHWLFGVTVFQGPSLDIFSLDENRMVRRLPLPKTSAWWWDGAWLGQEFFLFGYNGKEGELWKVLPRTTDRGPKFCKPIDGCDTQPVVLPDLAFDGKPVMMRVLASAGSLYVYEPLGWWFKLNRRTDVHKPFPGGIFRIDPTAHKVTAHLAPNTDFAQVIADPGGQYLYAIDAGQPSAGPVLLLKLDAKTGAVAVSRRLETDFWSISIASLPASSIPNGEMRPQACVSSTAGAPKP